MERTLQDLYIQGLETALNNIHGVKVQKELTSQFTLPIIEVKSNQFDLVDETLSKGHQTFRFGYDVSIYAQNIYTPQGIVSGGAVADDLKAIVFDYFNGIGFRCASSIRANNLDIDVSRRFVRVTGVYDSTTDILYRG